VCDGPAWWPEAIRCLLNFREPRGNRPAGEAGLALLEAGGDLADGVIAYEGSWLGEEIVVCFDGEAVKLMAAQDGSIRLLT